MDGSMEPMAYVVAGFKADSLKSVELGWTCRTPGPTPSSSRGVVPNPNHRQL